MGPAEVNSGIDAKWELAKGKGNRRAAGFTILNNRCAGQSHRLALGGSDLPHWLFREPAIAERNFGGREMG